MRLFSFDVHEGLNPSPLRLHLGARFGESVSHNGLLDEFLAEGLSPHHVFEGCGEGGAGLARYRDGDGEAIMVEIRLIASHQQQQPVKRGDVVVLP